MGYFQLLNARPFVTNRTCNRRPIVAIVSFAPIVSAVTLLYTHDRLLFIYNYNIYGYVCCKVTVETLVSLVTIGTIVIPLSVPEVTIA